MFYRSIKLISHDPVDLRKARSNMAAGSTGILKYSKPVGSSSFSTTQTFPDLDGLLSEKVPAKA